MSNTTAAERRAMQEFESRVQEHQAGLRAFIRALGVDEAWVDDLAQEAFIIAYRRLEEFQAGTDFGKWLRRIARNLAANERRKEARHSRLLPFAVADILLEQTTGGDALEPDLAHLLPFMRDCVGQLPARSQELLQRRYSAGETASDLARALRMNADAVRQALMRIRLAVRDCIEKKAGGVEL
jgi:RNA polymerase sigma-70 factor (ECF subfamily)